MSQNHHLPKELADLLAATPEVSDADLLRLKEAGERIDRDSADRAELQKAIFVNAILSALQREHLTKSEVARRMKCTRQNLNRLLAEDASVNFTIETLSNVATACNRRAEILVLADDEFAKVVKCQPDTNMLEFCGRNYYPIQTQPREIHSTYKACTSPRRNITPFDFTPQRIEKPSGDQLVA